MQKLALALVILASAAAAIANSKGDKLVQEIDSLQRPVPDQTKINDPSYRKAYQAKVNEFLEHRNELVLDLYKSDPENPKTADLMRSRWLQFTAKSKDIKSKFEAAEEDIAKVLSENPSPALQEAAADSKLVLDFRIFSASGTGELNSSQLQTIDEETQAFVEKYPKSSYAPELLFTESFQQSGATQVKIYREIVDKYPDSPNIAMVKGALAQIDLVGKPIPLSFDDAISGKHIDLASLKGKVVLLDFWATWCGPCVAEMPKVKDVYGQNHANGLEILGISLDKSPAEHGLEKLKAYVAKNQISWPMYYQGNYWQSEFSTSMGIMSIPTMFVIDKQGNFQGTIDPTSPDFNSKLAKFMAE